MRHFSLSTIALIALCAGVSAQQTQLVQHDDKNDPCGRFKMRILVPADVDHELATRTFTGGLDAGMVWNPCNRFPTLVAFGPASPVPDQSVPFFGNRSPLTQPPAGASDLISADGFLLTPLHSGVGFKSGPGKVELVPVPGNERRP
jgi:hypothetical protein